MQTRDFCYWLQGFFEISGKSEITPAQAEMIQNHLNMVFKHELENKSSTSVVSNNVPFSTVGSPTYMPNFMLHASC